METTPQKPTENGQPGSLRSSDLFGEATNAIKAWDVLTDTTRPNAFTGMKTAMEKLRDASDDIAADLNDVCITLTDCIEECEGFSDPSTANKLHEVRTVLLSYLPNSKAKP